MSVTPPTDIATLTQPQPDSAAYEAIIAELRALNTGLTASNAALLARIAELERRLGLNSTNSSKPPSSDGPKKPVRTSSLRERSGKASGGQKGHPGKTLRRTLTPDATVDHFPPACDGCGAPLDPAASTGHVARQVFDLPEPQPLEVTEHRAHRCTCTACGKQTRTAFPDGVTAPVQYGARIVAIVMYLAHLHMLPEKRLAQLLADLYGVHLVTATIAGMTRTCAKRFGGFVDGLFAHVAAAPVKHLDETGFRIAGRTAWLHVASTLWLTCYRTCTRRGSLPAGLAGIVVHDHWKPYFTLSGVLHALCNAHHLRELRALVEHEHEDRARRMQRLLQRACHAARMARAQNKPVAPYLVARIERCYDLILRQGLAYHAALPDLAVNPTGKDGRGRRGRKPHRIGHNLLLRLQSRKPDVLRFLSNPAVPFTNNLAEQDLRMMKLKQKVSGGLRSEEGARQFGVIRSVLSTARKQGWNILATLRAAPLRLADDLRLN